MWLGWPQQMLRFSSEGKVLNCGVTVVKELDVQEKFKLENLRFQSKYNFLLTGFTPESSF